MFEHGGDTDSAARLPRSRLYDYVDLARPDQPEATGAERPEGATSPDPAAPSADAADAISRRRREFAVLLGEFRRTAVLVPLGDGPGLDGERGLLTADLNGVRFILAFSDEQALARYAVARGEAAREWAYQTVLGARLLDVAVPAAGVPCGVALDCADGEDGMVFPPVRGIVPDRAAVDIDAETGDGA
ncbi:hypothetical protein ACFY0F_11895 [Streptomyces sp. NPDC001544]|uniref:hypothetical protein n=1 Tax=Streptomyces sp. NPDC001544 TaxID=3364584 RepID=UPI00369A0FAB